MDRIMRRYEKSEQMLDRALSSIPLGSQTFSKSHVQYPRGVSPYFAVRGKGSRIWDVDGNEYIDFVSGLCSINLGYGDPDVDAAVRSQLDNGVIFSISHALEYEVAEQIIDMVPCAEKVRFGKNGSDATAGAIRVARAFTGRDRVAVCGYHGWQDWFIGSTSRNAGVPQCVRDLTHTFSYNDIASLERLLTKWPGEFAAVIIEPMNVAEPIPGFLSDVKSLSSRYGALLVFDETITGFRFSSGGAQSLFGVVPDLATFGKGMANGYPVSAIAGRADVMSLMEEVFFSFTFGGEALSLAASLATMRKVKSENVTDALFRQGNKVTRGIESLLQKHGLEDTIGVAGHPSWSFVLFRDFASFKSLEIKTLYLQEMFQRGILTLGTHNMSYAHSDRDIATLLNAYDEVFTIVRTALDRKSLHSFLRCEVLKPLFKVR
jgi:glutamate-1-semialdehyde 2,1-aminomutase